MPILGINMPKMSMTKSRRLLAKTKPRPGVRTTLADALFSKTQQRVLGLLFGQPDRTFFANELIALTGSGSGGVQRELARLVDSGLLESREIGRQRHYQANAAAPIYAELHSIIVKTTGIAEPIRLALRAIADHILYAAIYGSVAKGSSTASSDLDLLVVSDDLRLVDLYKALESAETQLSRKISPTLYSAHEFVQRRQKKNPFLTKLLSGPQIPLIGNAGEIAPA